LVKNWDKGLDLRLRLQVVSHPVYLIMFKAVMAFLLLKLLNGQLLSELRDLAPQLSGLAPQPKLSGLAPQPKQ